MTHRLWERGSHSPIGRGQGPRRAHSASKERHWAGGRHTWVYYSPHFCVCIYVRIYIPLHEIILKPGSTVTKKVTHNISQQAECHELTWALPRLYSTATAALDSVFLCLQGGDSCPAQTVPTPFQSTHADWKDDQTNLTYISRRTRKTENLGYKRAVITWLTWFHSLAHFLQTSSLFSFISSFTFLLSWCLRSEIVQGWDQPQTRPSEMFSPAFREGCLKGGPAI